MSKKDLYDSLAAVMELRKICVLHHHNSTGEKKEQLRQAIELCDRISERIDKVLRREEANDAAS